MHRYYSEDAAAAVAAEREELAEAQVRLHRLGRRPSMNQNMKHEESMPDTAHVMKQYYSEDAAAAVAAERGETGYAQVLLRERAPYLRQAEAEEEEEALLDDTAEAEWLANTAAAQVAEQEVEAARLAAGGGSCRMNPQAEGGLVWSEEMAFDELHAILVQLGMDTTLAGALGHAERVEMIQQVVAANIEAESEEEISQETRPTPPPPITAEEAEALATGEQELIIFSFNLLNGCAQSAQRIWRVNEERLGVLASEHDMEPGEFATNMLTAVQEHFDGEAERTRLVRAVQYYAPAMARADVLCFQEVEDLQLLVDVLAQVGLIDCNKQDESAHPESEEGFVSPARLDEVEPRSGFELSAWCQRQEGWPDFSCVFARPGLGFEQQPLTEGTLGPMLSTDEWLHPANGNAGLPIAVARSELLGLDVLSAQFPPSATRPVSAARTTLDAMQRQLVQRQDNAIAMLRGATAGGEGVSARMRMLVVGDFNDNLSGYQMLAPDIYTESNGKSIRNRGSAEHFDTPTMRTFEVDENGRTTGTFKQRVDHCVALGAVEVTAAGAVPTEVGEFDSLLALLGGERVLSDHIPVIASCRISPDK
jgi:hypothetical protein